MNKLDGAKVAVVGGGLAGLVAAREFALAGHEVTLYEVANECGGAAKLHEVGGLSVDAGAESLATARPESRELVRSLGLEDLIAYPLREPAWLISGEGSAPLPRGGMWGIPLDPTAPEVVAHLGAAGAARAANDLVAPLSEAEREVFSVPHLSLGDLVEVRMGATVVTRLVAPIVAGVQSASAYDIAADEIAPGLREACLEHGGLIKGVQALQAARAAASDHAATAGAAVIGLRGGVGTLSETLVADIMRHGGTVVTNSAVTDITMTTPVAPGRRRARYRVTVKGYIDGGLAARFDAAGGGIRFNNDVGYAMSIAEADVVILAVTPAAAHGLVRKIEPRSSKILRAEPDPTVVHLATLIAHAPVWDSAPRGTGALVTRDAKHVRAKALTHASAKWEWLKSDLVKAYGPSHHLVRLSYRDEPGLPGSMADVLGDAEAILGERGSDARPRAFATVTWSDQQMVRHRDHAQAVATVRANLAALSDGHDHVALIGTWAAGSGIGLVVADAHRESHRILAALQGAGFTGAE